ncbi:hypothetical protein BBJ28_00015245 [Nothophytophthora sp. Chile5]|nr:hypothetical protein BBJ28_00015245 [Nothophytophthora sp. Chile5]
MESARSEYSESSVASSRLDDGSGSSRTTSRSSSHASGLSIDSASARSAYLSNFAQRFLERKAAKHKRSERDKREQEREDQQQLIYADQKRQVDREAERLARRLEMETWLTDPAELRRVERRTQKRSRDRMRALQEWYPSALPGPSDELQPVFVAASTQQSSNQQQPSQKPLLAGMAATAREEEDRVVLEAALQRQLSDFTTKLTYLEHHVRSTPGAQTRGKSRRRRVARETLQLAPLPRASGIHNGFRSTQNRHGGLSSGYPDDRLAASASLQRLQSRVQTCCGALEDEEALDAAELQQFLTRHRQSAMQGRAARKLQALWRMYLRRRVYIPWRRRRMRQRRAVFEIWAMTHRVGRRAQRSLLRKYLVEWREEVAEALQLRAMELQLFRHAATQATLPHMVLNLVFTSDWDGEWGRRGASEAKPKTTKPATDTALDAILNSAFAGVETTTAEAGRVQQLRMQHLAAREEVLKKVVQHVFRRWKQLHETTKRVGLNAQLCLKRAVRMAFGSRQRWPAETLLAAFDIWARWAAFSRCKRLGLPLPSFPQANPQWDIWLHNYQERQVRCVKAAAKAPIARLGRFFRRLRAFARQAIAHRRATLLAKQFFAHTLRRNVLRAWRAAIAEQSTVKKLTRLALLRLLHYARAKRKLRPLKQTLRQLQHEWTSRRTWRAWQRVQLRACFKRELNLARLENSQAWRTRLHRTLALWRDDRDARVQWRTFEAWTHVVRKRKLFLTMRHLCARLQRRHLLFGVFTAWKAVVCERIDGFLEDRLRLDAWEAYRELSAFFPMLFYGCFSDARAIFGGLPSSTSDKGNSNSLQRTKQEEQELLLATSGDGVRHFHGELVHASVVEVRNAILQTRHLVNAVDDASGNTALHVAAQMEEPARRLEVMALLLSEGAATLQRANRHGLTPTQLAPDAETRLLLAEGIFAFNSREILARRLTTETAESSQRLLWCVATLMTSEWTVGKRIAADVRAGQWHSTLRAELWLRQQHIRFSADSTFASGISRSRAFLNGLKTRLCRSAQTLLDASRPPNPGSTAVEDPEVARKQRYEQWRQQDKTRRARARKLGEYEAYGRYLLAATLDPEACEQNLVPSFVGLLFSLDFSVDEVLSEAFRLEELCADAEHELWELYQRLRRAERGWSIVLGSREQLGSYDVGLLRLFSEGADVDLFFRKELILLELEPCRNCNERERETVITELESLLTWKQRKLRKVEKKVKRVQNQLDEHESACRAALFTTSRRVQQICVTRMDLERSRLRMAAALIKLSDIQAVVTRLEGAKRQLQAAIPTRLPSLSPPDSTEEADNGRKAFLEAEMARYSGMFQTKALLEETRDGPRKVENLPEPLNALQKQAVDKLHTLFVLNLFRCCCCWLADNMLALVAAEASEGGDGTGNKTEGEQQDAAVEASDAERQLTAAKGAGASREDFVRRRSSLRNTRRVLETFHRGCTVPNLLDSEDDAMEAAYAASSSLIFEAERRAEREAEQQRVNGARQVAVVTCLERNPITGQLETAPNHLVALETLVDRKQTEATPPADTRGVSRNRKKQELQRALALQQLSRKSRVAASKSDDEDEHEADTRPSGLLPAIHGLGLEFANFVISGGAVVVDGSALVENNALVCGKEDNVEAMWQRGGAAPNIKEVMATTRVVHASKQSKLRPDGPSHVSIEQSSPDRPQSREPEQEQRQVAVEASHSIPCQADAVLATKQTGIEGDEGIKESRRSLMQASSASSLLLPTLSSIPSSPPPLTAVETSVKDEGERPRTEQHDVKEEQPPPIQELRDHLVIPAVQINTRSRQELVGAGRQDLSEEERATLSSQTATQEQEDQRQIEKSPQLAAEPVEAQSDDEDETLREYRLQARASPQSPIGEVNVSPMMVATGGRFSARSLTSKGVHTTNATAFAMESSAFGDMVAPFIKWEETTALEVFPLAVVAANRPSSEATGATRSSRSREKTPPVANVESASIARSVRGGISFEREEELEPTTERTIDPLALQGTTLTMTSKRSGVRTRRSVISTGTGVQDPEAVKPRPKKKRETVTSAGKVRLGSASSSRRTPSITVTVVTKATAVQESAHEPVGAVATSIRSHPSLPPVETSAASSPKAREKPQWLLSQQEASETQPQPQPPLLLELKVVGLNNSEIPNTEEAIAREAPLKTSEQRVSPHKRLQTAQSSSRQSRGSGSLTTASCEDFTLEGARLSAPATKGRKSILQPVESTGLEGMPPLSKQQKERLWQDFAATSLSPSVQNAYAVLYPRTYASIATAEGEGAEQTVSSFLATESARSQSPLMAVAEPSEVALSVDATPHSSQKAIQINRKFWSAVEGYRAIGSSPLVPLDAATISQRRRDKAEAIFDQFFRGQRSGSRTGGMALEWLAMYPKAVEKVQRQLASAPKGLFDELQQTAELQISAALSKQQISELTRDAFDKKKTAHNPTSVLTGKIPANRENCISMSPLNLSKLFNVTGKVVVITGGGRGLGKMMADGFVQNGAKVYVASNDMESCVATAKELNEKGSGQCFAVRAVEADLISEAACKALAEEIAKKETRVDVLINNAGFAYGGPIESHGEKGPYHSLRLLPLLLLLYDSSPLISPPTCTVWNKVLAVNVTSPFHLTRYLLPLLDAAAITPDSARIINIGSCAGFMPQMIDTFAYDTSKAAMHHMTRVLAAKLARRPNGGHILVNAIAPGLVPTQMAKGIARATGVPVEKMTSFIPLERYATDADMAGLAIFLASKASVTNLWLNFTVVVMATQPERPATMSALSLSKLFSVQGKVVVITGGGRGIGKMIADGFVQNGAKIYIASRRLEACEATAEELNAKGPGHCFPLADEIAKKESRVDVLINNSGVTWGGDFGHHPEAGNKTPLPASHACCTDTTACCDLEAWNKVLSVNVTSPFHLTHHMLPLLDEAAVSSDGARVINMGSMAGLVPQRIDTIAYDTSKAAVHHMTRGLAAKLARRPNGGHILVNAIAPGVVPSKMSKGIAVASGRPMDDLANEIPLQRFGNDADMAGLAIFLASRASGWITGTVISSDGGQIHAAETGAGPQDH